ncbi:MAG: S1-C subfamily serine protease [Verrucomicrobiales bacterium]|jgi:S1-C subfamily serine protease
MIRFFAKVSALLFLLQLVDAVEFDALALTKQVQKSADRVWPGVVSIERGGYASGVVISPQGLIATAGHVLKGAKNTDGVKVTFPDGKVAYARALGRNFETDTGLLQITTERDGPWPFTPLSAKPVAAGDFCFTLAHPAGEADGRPAQLRLGRITMLRLRDGKPWFATADVEIQPGDSGGPLFDPDGALIGIDSSAATKRGFNRFALASTLLDDFKALKSMRRIGKLEDGPGGDIGNGLEINPATLEKLGAVFHGRFAAGHRPTVEFVRKRSSGGKDVKINQSEMANFLVPDVFALSSGVPISMGIEDPALIEKLPDLPAGAVAPLKIYAGQSLVTYGIRVHEKYIIAKKSELSEGEEIRWRVGGELYPLSERAGIKEFDLSLLEIRIAPEKDKAPILRFPEGEVRDTLRAGTGLMAIDGRGLKTWGVACDHSREVPKEITIGPLDDKDELISRLRAPIANATTHNLRLYAADAGTPIYDLEGRFVGMHHGRLSRTLGLLLPAEVISQLTQAIIGKLEAEE